MAEPILEVRNLKTYFQQDEGVVRAVDGASFTLHPGRTLGIVGESGCGKSVTARSILRIVERPGRIEGGEIWLRRRRTASGSTSPSSTRESRSIREIRGGEIGLVFQEPMTSFSAFHTVGNQMIEAIRLHSDAVEGGGAGTRDRAAAHGRHPAAASGGSTSTPSSCRAACASG